MKANQINVFNDQNIQTEIENVYSVLNRVSFASNGFNNGRAENMDAYLVDVTANATASYDTAITHDLKRVPIGYLILGQSASALFYNGSATNTDTQLFIKCTTSSTRFRVAVI